MLRILHKSFGLVLALIIFNHNLNYDPKSKLVLRLIKLLIANACAVAQNPFLL